jgi:hypothetical protein
MKNVTGKVLVPFTYKGEDYKEGDEITLPASCRQIRKAELYQADP